MKAAYSKTRAFRALVWKHYRLHGRHTLPWRKTRDPYAILVSEMMLQQTRVERVIPYFEEWMRTFPSVHAAARAPLSKILRTWQGLGYNRRAKMLHETAKAIVKKHGGVFPKSSEALEALPGVGPYTAGAVAAFAYNEDVGFVETNIRTAVLHHFFPPNSKNTTTYGSISDTEILSVVERALPKGRAREWYAALMDYGAHLKKTGVRLNARAKGYVKQKKFAGSGREARGAILKALARGSKPAPFLLDLLGPSRRSQMKRQLGALTKEGLITLRGGMFRLPR